MPAVPAPPSVSPQVVRDVTAFVRALFSAFRGQQMYSAGHSAVGRALERCRATIAPLLAHDGLAIGFSPDTLLINGEPVATDPRTREACALLNALDIVRLRVLIQPSIRELSDFLQLLTMGGTTVRDRGGPVRVWEQYDHHWLMIDQIDYERLTTSASGDAKAGVAEAADARRRKVLQRDNAWRTLVRAMAGGRAPIDGLARSRLLDIAQSPEAIHELACDAAAAQSGEGAAREAAQAAAVLMTFHRLSSFVRLEAPGDLESVSANIAEAAAQVEPHLLMRAVNETAESGLGTEVVDAIASRFDDEETAKMLAAALAAEGKASTRMASALATLVGDEERRKRILRLARLHADAIVPGGPEAVTSFWTTFERLLDGPADAMFVSKLYGESIEQAAARAERLRTDAPAQLGGWVASVSAESVRTLSATVVLDLFTLERDPTALVETAHDLAELADDFLSVGGAVDAARVADALNLAARDGEPARARAAEAGLADIATCAGVRDVLTSLDDVPAHEADAVERLCQTLGPRVALVLVEILSSMPPGAARDRVRGLLGSLDDRALDILVAFAEQAPPAQVHEVVLAVSRIGGPRASRELRAWVRGGRFDLAREAVMALVTSSNPTAAQALAALLRGGTASARSAAVEAVAESRHPAAAGVLAALLGELDVLHNDHRLGMQVLAALRGIAGADAVPAVAQASAVWSWRAWRRAGRVKQAAVNALAETPGEDARHALEQLARQADFRVRGLARAALTRERIR